MHSAFLKFAPQELGGINNSHAARLLAQERQSWQEQAQRSTEAGTASPAPVEQPSAPPPAGAASAPEPAAPELERPSDEPYIETPRCTSCNECIQINDKMFGYNKEKQAFVLNAGAGPLRQLVEAAESCQVSIIHPGKPRDPNEAGLEELMKRAEPFL
jgi:ferredoxin